MTLASSNASVNELKEVALPAPAVVWEGEVEQDPDDDAWRTTEAAGRWRIVLAWRHPTSYGSYGTAYPVMTRVVSRAAIERSIATDALGNRTWEPQNALPADILVLVLKACGRVGQGSSQADPEKPTVEDVRARVA